MNKKFTMMLAAFVAAGYTITAEAGVVKASKPGTTAKTYVIGDGIAFIGSSDDASGSGTPITVKGLADATKWKSSIDDSGLFTIVDAKEDNSDNAGVRYLGSKFVYAQGANAESYIGLEDATEGFYYLKGASSCLGKTEDGWIRTDKSNASLISFYEVGVPVADASDKALIINGKYVVIDGANVKLVDRAAYMEKPTKWTIADGKIYSSSSYLQFDGEGNLIVGEDSNADIFETANGYLTVVNQNKTVEASKYVQFIDGKVVAKILGTEQAPDNTLSATALTTETVPTAITDAYPSAVYGFPANSRLMVNISDTWKSFVMNADQTVAADSESPEEGDNAYWSLNGTNLTNKNGIMVLKDASNNVYQNFEVYYTTSQTSTARSFYLKVKGEDLFVLEDFTVGNTGSYALFSAIAPATDDISAIELNDINSGSFTLGYKFDDSHKATDNPFNKEMKAFYVEGEENTFYLATKWPAKYNSTTDCKVDNVADLQENTFTFIVATPNNHWDIREFDAFGEGSKFTEVSGARLVADDYQDIKSNKHPLQNAAFGMYKVKGGNYVLTMGSLVYYSEDETKESEEMTIALVAHDNKRVVTTIEKGNSEVANEVSFGATIDNLRTVQVKDFLKSDKASVFNIKFLSQNAVADDNWSSNDKATMSEYNKYLGINAEGLFAQGSDFVNLSAPENQWIVVDADKDANTFTFQNRELNNVKFTAELTSTTDGTNVYVLRNTSSAEVNYAYVDKDGKYMLASEVSGVNTLSTLSGAKVQLVSVTPVAEAGYASVELDNAGLVRFAFESRTTSLVAAKSFMTAEQNKSGNSGKVAVSQEEADAAQFSLVKFDAASTSTALSDTIYAVNDYAYWANDKVNVKSDADTIAVVTYAFKQLRADGKNYYLADDMLTVKEQNDVTKAPRFIVKINKNGSYTLIKATDASYVRDVITAGQTTPTVNTVNSDMTGEGTSIYYDYTSERAFDLNILKETPGTTYNHVPQHVTMEAVNGGYVAMNVENNEGIVAPVSTLKAEYTKEDLTFWLDTTDTEAVTPSFMISKAGNYMYNATDSLDYYNDGTASAEKAKEFGIQVGGNTDLLPKAIFQKADLTKVEDVENYKFQIVQSADSEDEYVIRSLNGYSYVAAHNQKLYFTSEAKEALKVVVTRVEAPTSNESVSATEVKVVAQDGSVVVKNAAGKNVVVSTILGQVVANEVLTSDNATINVPAGIVVVAVEGESFKVNVK